MGNNDKKKTNEQVKKPSTVCAGQLICTAGVKTDLRRIVLIGDTVQALENGQSARILEKW